MFAFALWDRNSETLFLARDRLGVKPLYYAQLPDGQLLFASELKALVAHGGMPSDLDPLAVEDYFALGYVPEPRCIFTAAKAAAGIDACRPARAAAAGTAGILGRSIRAGPCHRRRCRRGELIARLRESIRLRMISEVPLGAFLSGGVDSSAVVALMAGCRRGR